MSKYKSGVRIIGGRWKGRKVPVPDAAGLRPTSDRIRETLFNWLHPVVEGARCLDLFAGSGALSFEALSRGASAVVAIDTNRRSVKAIRETQELLGAGGLTLIQDRVERVLLTPPQTSFDIVFLDPPFDYLGYEAACHLLHRNNWLSSPAFVYVEAEKGNEFDYPEGWKRCKSGRAGNVEYQLLQTRFC